MAQFEQTVDPGRLENLPAAQFWHDVAPDELPKVPGEQSRQVDEDDAPRVVLYLPMAQFTHVANVVAPTAVL